MDKVGNSYKGFVVTKYLPIEEIQATLVELIHEPTGASIMHIQNKDTENAFCLSFQTWPSSSNGVAHVLEHTVLCGSKKFPVKDPFFSMLKRSLHTYMNAITAPDFTCYPAASQVKKDFYNLLLVYLDAVFYPKLAPLSFLQEGHRLEFEEPDNPASPLIYKGIVLNEMKGAMNSGEARLWQTMMQNLLPDLPYAFNSGGDPAEIPLLTYRELKEFHENYYNPSHCLFYFYGNIPLQKHLDFIGHHILQHVEKTSPPDPVRKQERFTSPKICEEKFPIGEESKALIAFGWLTTTVSEQEETLALSLLDSILMENDASLLKRELLRSKLLTTAESTLEIETSEIPWVLICKGCNKEDAGKIRKLLFSSLEKIVSKKISKELIAAALHQLEFSRTEITGDSFPHGLSLFMRAGLLKQHGCDAEKGLMIHSLFQKLSTLTQDPDYLPSLIKKHFLQNSHMVELTMIPDKDLSAKEQEIEKKTLQRLHTILRPEQKEKILLQTKKLKKHQEEAEKTSLDCLPTVSITDIPKKLIDFPLKQLKNDFFFYDGFTNQILYVDLVFDIPAIDYEDLAFLPLLAEFLPELGAGKKTWENHLSEIHAYTGGIDTFLTPNAHATGIDIFSPTFCVRGKALYRNSEKLFHLLKNLLTTPDFSDKKRMRDLLKQGQTNLVHCLSKNAMRYAVSLSLCTSPVGHIHDRWRGFAYYEYLQGLCRDVNKAIDRAIISFERLKKNIFTKNNLHIVISCDKKHFLHLKAHHFYSIEDLPRQKERRPFSLPPYPPVTSQGRILSSPVAFTSYAMRTVRYTHEDAPSILVATELFNNLVLHKEIREKGGAYGSGATYAPTTGDFYFYAFRDPHLLQTIESFKKSLQMIAQGHFDKQDLFDAKLGILQGIDAPISPGRRGITSFLYRITGKTKKMREIFRKHVLACTSLNIQQAIENHLYSQRENGVLISFADKSFLEKEMGQTLPSLPISPEVV